MVRSLLDVHSFQGLAGVYRKFAPDFALVVIPLFQLLNVDQHEFHTYMNSTQPMSKPTPKTTLKTTLGSKLMPNPTPESMSATGQQLMAEANGRLEQIITTHPALALPERGNTDFTVCTDASDYAIGGPLHQMQA
jgi:hypothetical protein